MGKAHSRETTLENTGSGLRLLPPEILGCITRHLRWDDIARLLQTGHQYLILQLQRLHAIEALNIEIDWDKVPGKALFWPTFVYRLKHLQHFSCTRNPWSKTAFANIRLDWLPSSLKSLRIDTANVGDILLPSTTATEWFNLGQLFPHLTALKLPVSLYDAQLNWARSLPPNLSTFSLRLWHTRVPLPNSLTKLTADVVTVTLGKPQIPKGLIHLKVRSTIDRIQFFDRLPDTLLHLDINHTSMPDGWVKRLPSKLLTLNARKTQDREFHRIPAEALDLPSPLSIFPRNLTRLHTFLISDYSLWKCLPPGLTDLSFTTNQRQVDQAKRMFDAIASLPSSLLHLDLPRTSYTDPVPDLRLPPNLKTLVVSVQVTKVLAKTLPRSLTLLSVDSIYEEALTELPRALTDVECGILQIDNFELFGSSLPPNLVSLTAELSGGFSDSDTSEPTPLPKTLRRFRAPGNEQAFLDDNSVLIFCNSNLEYTTFDASPELTDDGIKLLQHLTSLRMLELISDVPLVTGACFQFLPRGLRYLRLESVTAVTDSHFEHLPPGLQTAILPHAQKLTLKAIAKAPKTLTYLNLQYLELPKPSLKHIPTALKYSAQGISTARWLCCHGKLEF